MATSFETLLLRRRGLFGKGASFLRVTLKNIQNSKEKIVDNSFLVLKNNTYRSTGRRSSNTLLKNYRAQIKVESNGNCPCRPMCFVVAVRVEESLRVTEATEREWSEIFEKLLLWIALSWVNCNLGQVSGPTIQSWINFYKNTTSTLSIGDK